MSTYHDPEDNTCEKTDRYERLIDMADYLRDEARDRMCVPDEPSPEEIAADAADIADDNKEMRQELVADALAILTKCNFMLTGYETQVCETAAGHDTGMQIVDMDTFTTLRTQFSKEISDHYRSR